MSVDDLHNTICKMFAEKDRENEQLQAENKRLEHKDCKRLTRIAGFLTEINTLKENGTDLEAEIKRLKNERGCKVCPHYLRDLAEYTRKAYMKEGE